MTKQPYHTQAIVSTKLSAVADSIVPSVCLFTTDRVLVCACGGGVAIDRVDWKFTEERDNINNMMHHHKSMQLAR